MTISASQSDGSTASSAMPARIPTGQELFDLIMAHFEPDLTTEGLKSIKEKYKSETPEQFAERKKRYAFAFERYEQAYQGYLDTLQGQVERYRRVSFRQAELDVRKNDDAAADRIGRSFLNAA